MSIPNDFLKERFDPVIYNFCDNLILGITQTYGSKVLERGRIITFGDKANIRRISFLIHKGDSEGISIGIEKKGSHSGLVLLVNEVMHPIKSRSLKGLEGEGNSLNLL